MGMQTALPEVKAHKRQVRGLQFVEIAPTSGVTGVVVETQQAEQHCHQQQRNKSFGPLRDPLLTCALEKPDVSISLHQHLTTERPAQAVNDGSEEYPPTTTPVKEQTRGTAIRYRHGVQLFYCAGKHFSILGACGIV
jgi:hypothetical protein